MDDKLKLIKELNKSPLQKHARKLLKWEEEDITNDELYLVQVARQITENYYVQEYIRKNIRLLVHDRLIEDLFDMIEKEPAEQLEIMLNKEGDGSEEDLMDCIELHEMALVIMQTLIDKREARDGYPYDNM